MVISVFLWGLCGYIWDNILTLSTQREIGMHTTSNIQCPTMLYIAGKDAHSGGSIRIVEELPFYIGVHYVLYP